MPERRSKGDDPVYFEHNGPMHAAAGAWADKFVLEPLPAVIGSIWLRDLDVTNVDKALAAAAATPSSATVAMAHLALTWAITRAQAKDRVLRLGGPRRAATPR